VVQEGILVKNSLERQEQSEGRGKKSMGKLRVKQSERQEQGQEEPSAQRTGKIPE